MDDKLKRELSAAVDRGADDPKVKKLIAGDAQARAYFQGLLAVDRALREWPARSSDSPATDSFVDAVLARLDEPLSNDDFDPFAAPFADEREATKNPRQHTEQHEMSQSNDQDNEDDLEGLAALMRPSRTGSSASVPPPPVSMRPGPALADDAMDESSGIVDIKHLAAIAKRASVPPASEEAPKAEAKSEDKSAEKADEKSAKAEAKSEKKDGDKAEKSAKPAEKKAEKSSAKSDEKGTKSDKSEKAAQAVPASTAASEPVAEKKGTSPVIWIAGIGLAAGIAFVAGRQGNNPTTSVNAEAPQSAAPAQSPVATAGNAGAAPAAQPSVAAPTQPPAVTQPAAADPAANAQAPAQAQPEQAAAAPTVVANQPAAPRAEEGRPAPANAEPAAVLAQGAIGGAGGARAANDGAEAERRVAAASPTRTREAASGSSATATERATTATSTGAATTAGTATARPAQATQAAPSGTAARGSSTATATTGATATPTTAAGSGGAATGASRPLSVQELMDRATGRDRQQAAAAASQQAAASQAAALPPQLTRSMVQSTMGPFNSAVRACAQGQTGTATAILTVNGDGSVANAAVSSPWGSGPNDCITNRLRTARFPAVQRPSSRVVYPFSVLAPQPGG